MSQTATSERVSRPRSAGVIQRRMALTPWLFLAPFLTVFALFYLAPVGYALYLSLFIKKRSGIGPAQDVFGGLTNYLRAFTDSDFLHSLLNILLFGIVQVPLMLIVATSLALILDAVKNRAGAAFRTAFYLPYTIPSVIAGLLWGYLYSKNLSPFNQIAQKLGGGGVDFLSSSVVLWSIAVIVTWTWTGYNVITLYAALKNVSADLYEAARIDGATGWNLTRYIKLPLLRPALLLSLIFSIIGTMQIFSEPFVLRPLGYVPDNLTPNLYVYLTVARDGSFGYGAALAVVLALVTFLLSIFFLRYTRTGGEV